MSKKLGLFASCRKLIYIIQKLKAKIFNCYVKFAAKRKIYTLCKFCGKKQKLKNKLQKWWFFKNPVKNQK